MPYQVFEVPKDSGQWFVYKEDADGKRIGEPHNSEGYPSKQAAIPLLRALYAAEKRAPVHEIEGMPADEPPVSLQDTPPALPQSDAHYTIHSPDEAHACQHCAFFTGQTCELIANEPDPIVPDGHCDYFEGIDDPTQTLSPAVYPTPFAEMARDLPIAKGDPQWDASEARARIWAWATDKDGNIDVAKAAQAFLICDGDGKDGLKDPIADVINGHLEVIPAALRAASSRLPQTDAEGKSSAASVLAHYKKQAGIGDSAAELTASTSETFREIGMTTVFKGSVPDVPFAPGVQKDQLTAGDPSPVFVTMKIAQIGRTSRNKVVYDKALVDAIVEQINRKKTGGIFGHIPDGERDSAFPLPDGLWVGATLVGDTAYGKAYIRDPKAANYVRHLKAVGGSLGTSIYGTGIAEATSDGARRFKEFVLEQLDFAPPDRASLDMGGAFDLTSEMNGDTPMSVTKEQLAELSVSALYALLDESMATGITEMHAKKNGKKVVAAEMAADAESAVVKISELTTQTSTQARELGTLRTRVAEYEQAEFANGSKALIGDALPWKNLDRADANQRALANSVFTQLHKALLREMDGKHDLTFARAKVAELVESDEFRPVIQNTAVTLAGGSAVIGGLAGGKVKTLEEMEKALQEQRHQEGVN